MDPEFKKLTTIGTNADIIPGFLPNLPPTQLKNIVPKAPPIHRIDPTHDASNKLIGPHGRGVPSDFNSGKLADGHPTAMPYMSVIKFAK